MTTALTAGLGLLSPEFAAHVATSAERLLPVLPESYPGKARATRPRCRDSR